MAEKKLTFEEALKELETTASKLKSDDISLEEAVSGYEQGLAYYKECMRILDEAKQRVEVLKNE